jgi:hypothetical protein
MSKTQTETKKEKKVTPKVDLVPKWKLEEQCFEDAKMKDLDGKEFTWPRTKPGEQRKYEQYFLDKVVDPTSGHYYPKRDEDGRPVRTGENPKHTINTIIRIKRKDNTEYLYSKGNLISYDGLGDPVKMYVSMPEKWLKTNFGYEKDWNPKTKQVEKICTGPRTTEDVYTMEFNEANLKQLFDKRENDYIQWVVKEEQSQIPRQVLPEPNINDTFKLFLKPFEYLYNVQYMTPEMKAHHRQEAIDAGLLTAPTTGATTTTTTSAPPKGTYS